MPRYSFECRFCDGITEIYLHDGDKLNYRAVRCEICGKKHLRLVLYVKHVAQLIAILQEQLEEMAIKIEELENGSEGGHTYEVKN